ncbi:hypothetical protein BaRGS_00001261 [Batillaria attramentaria]|uniref:Uncharacterized protein n=1 Tax=Batillaria attramentaria TaxID=370345 RepID=A0ABD0M6P0_9CAEN
MEGKCAWSSVMKQHVFQTDGWKSMFGRVLVLWFCLEAIVRPTDGYSGNTVTEVPASTLSPAFFGNITLTPSIKENYTLHLSTSGPAVLDSQVTFKADLTVDSDIPIARRRFCYEWLNDADGSRAKTIGGYHSELQKTFSRDKVKPGVYLITVIVSPTSKLEEILAFKAMEFRLTEELHKCNSSRVDSEAMDESVKLGNPVVLNVTCISGSSPSAVCWNVTEGKPGNDTLNSTCQPADSDFQNTTFHQVSVSLGQTGWQTVHLAIYNDVSYYTFLQTFYVYDADYVNVPALVFPIVFVVIGIVISVAGGAYLVRLRRTLHVEVADFDFDPSISVRSPHIFSSAATAIKHFFHRLRHRNNTDNLGQRPARRVHTQRLQSLYETL